jgi:hypothetical protein
MTYMKIMYGHCIFTPGDQTFPVIGPTGMREPHLFAERLGYGSLFSCKPLFFGVNIINIAFGHSASVAGLETLCHLWT